MIGGLAAVAAAALTGSAGSAPARPTVATSPATGISLTGATLRGSVDPRGVPTRYAFQFGTTTRYGGQTAVTSAGSGTKSVAVSHGVSGLQPNTLYHFRLIANGGGGTVNGADRTFTTAAVPLTVHAAHFPDPVVFGRSFIVNGSLSGSAAANHTIVLVFRPFPFTSAFRRLAGPLLTDANGRFTFDAAGLTVTSEIYVDAGGRPTVRSPAVIEHVAVRAVLHARRTKRAHVVRLFGAIAPPEVRAPVALQRRVGGIWRTVAATTSTPATPSTSGFSVRVRVRRRGLYRAVVLASRIDGSHVDGHSRPIRVG